MIDILDQIQYAENFLQILTKRGTKDFLKYNKHQVYLCELIKKLRAEGKPPRIIILKARQLGFSTCVSSIVFKECATEFYQKSMIIAHDDDSTNNIFNMCKRYYDFLPSEIRPMKRYSNAKELVFENPDEKARKENSGLESRIEIETANKPTAGRSGTIQKLHASEMAFWKNAGTTCTSLLQSVPLTINSLIIIESTANGMSGDGQEFYQRWQDAKSGKSDFTPVFFPWYEEEAYEMDDSNFVPDQEEIEYMETFPFLTKRKMAWRRYKIKNEMGGSSIDPYDMFKQEYPTIPEEAFVSSGRPVFNITKIQKDIERAKKIEFKRGDFNSDGTFTESDRGSTKVFKRSTKPNCALGADVAQGIVGGDYSAASILDTDMFQMCSYHRHIDPDLFGIDLIKLGKAFNNCVLAVEMNNHGHSTVSTLKKESYSNIYRVETMDEKTDKKTWRLGWLTTAKSKMLMIDALIAAYRDNDITINDVDLLQEMATLTFEENGNIELTGKDRVVAMCIAIQALKQVVGPARPAYYPNQKPKDSASFEEKIRYHTKQLDNGSWFD
jgi:hypothetical protein